MTDDERDLVAQLRAEATTVKQCFTTYSFQALAIGTTALAASFGAMKVAGDYAAYISLPAIAVLVAVSRMGIHKYATANRNSGYELHLARSRGVNDKQWADDVHTLAWEEALRAWRIVQPTLFRFIYRTPQDHGAAVNYASLPRFMTSLYDSISPSLYQLTAAADRVRQDFEPHSRRGGGENYPWFLPRVLAEKSTEPNGSSATYYAGSYLESMLSVLALLQFLMLLPLFFVVVRGAVCYMGWLVLPSLPPQKIAIVTLHTAVLVILGVLLALRARRIARRREILEDELLSIHSCALVWHAVSYIHFAVRDERPGSYHAYTERLAARAKDYVAAHALNLPSTSQAQRWSQAPTGNGGGVATSHAQSSMSPSGLNG